MEARAEERKDERSLGELFAELAGETSTLVRQEINLARTELTQKAKQVGKNIALLAVGVAVVYAGFLALLAALIAGLVVLGLPWWASAALVGLVVAVIGYVLIQRGREALAREDLVPRQTVATLKEDAEWAKQQTN